jgi:hypothetical protein
MYSFSSEQTQQKFQSEKEWKTRIFKNLKIFIYFLFSQKKAKNKNASPTDSGSSQKSYPTEISNNEKIGWTTWLHKATLSLATIFPSNPTNLRMNIILYNLIINSFLFFLYQMQIHQSLY